MCYKKQNIKCGIKNKYQMCYKKQNIISGIRNKSISNVIANNYSRKNARTVLEIQTHLFPTAH